MRELSLPEFVHAVQHGGLDELSGAPGRCPRCERDNPSGVLIRRRHLTYCPACLPREKQCARCRRLFDVTEFHALLSPKVQRLESYCARCTRERSRNQYYEKRLEQLPVARSKRCRECGQVKPASAFHRDARYAGRLEPLCKSCKATVWLEYIRTPRGREAFQAAQAAHKRKHGRGGEASR